MLRPSPVARQKRRLHAIDGVNAASVVKQRLWTVLSVLHKFHCYWHSAPTASNNSKFMWIIYLRSLNKIAFIKISRNLSASSEITMYCRVDYYVAVAYSSDWSRYEGHAKCRCDRRRVR